jgi:hypothetical protein
MDPLFKIKFKLQIKINMMNSFIILIIAFNLILFYLNKFIFTQIQNLPK